MLDVCAGTGSVAGLAAEQGWDVVAVDRNFQMLGQIRSPTISRVCSDALRLPFGDRSFDLVVMRQALHYLEPANAIREMFRVARSEIRLGHITMFDAEDLPLWREYFAVVSPGRLHIFAPGDIARAVVAANGKVVAVKTKFATDEFAGPIQHLGSKTVTRMRELFVEAPEKIKTKYLRKGRGRSDFRLRLRWEFISAIRSPNS